MAPSIASRAADHLVWAFSMKVVCLVAGPHDLADLTELFFSSLAIAGRAEVEILRPLALFAFPRFFTAARDAFNAGRALVVDLQQGRNLVL